MALDRTGLLRGLNADYALLQEVKVWYASRWMPCPYKRPWPRPLAAMVVKYENGELSIYEEPWIKEAQ